MLAHGIYMLVFLVLVVTGVLLYSPDLRIMLTSGYSLLISKIHKYAGVAAVPSLAAYGIPLVRNRTEPARWQRVHIIFVFASGALFILTGFALWCITNTHVVLVDMSLWIHRILTVLAMGFVCMHVIFLRGASRT